MGIDTPLLDNTTANWQSLMVAQDLQLQNEEADEGRAIAICKELLDKSNAQVHQIFDFDDMLYVPLRLGTSFDRFNVVYIDEAQDTNAVQCALLERMIARAPHGRLIAVGDPDQAIYGFRGASDEAMENMRKQFDMDVLPLSVSYRCSKSVVREAQKFCSTK